MNAYTHTRTRMITYCHLSQYNQLLDFIYDIKLSQTFCHVVKTMDAEATATMTACYVNSRPNSLVHYHDHTIKSGLQATFMA